MNLKPEIISAIEKLLEYVEDHNRTSEFYHGNKPIRRVAERVEAWLATYQPEEKDV